MSSIKITLKSDLCTASGDGFASSVDTDVCYDECGLPYIPARRLKGCLREAAEYINTDKAVIEKIFGVSGSMQSGSLHLSNGYLPDYEKKREEIKASGLHSSEVIARFTSEKASTAIDKDGHAKDESLRLVRVINHYYMESDEELYFVAELELDPQYAEDFNKICKALRNIGYKRSRGFGAVRCEYICTEKKTEDTVSVSGDVCRIGYTVFLKTALMLPAGTSVESGDYIPGSSVLGSFAAKYLSENKFGKEFEDIFLSGQVSFSPLYVTDKKDSYSIPAPPFVGKIKGESDRVNITYYHDKEDRPIIKPLKGGYFTEGGQYISLKGETVYHHTNRTDEQLYTQTCLAEGQYFSGIISGKTELVKKIFPAKGAALRFGRSKTAQYSLCEVVSVEDLSDTLKKEITVSQGKLYGALLMSDTLLTDEYGSYNPDFSTLVQSIKASDERLSDIAVDCEYSVLRYNTLMGFNTKRGLQNPHVKAAAAGSVIVFKADKDGSLPYEIAVGGRKNEGLGRVRIIPVTDFVIDNSAPERSETASSVGSELADKNEELLNDALNVYEKVKEDFHKLASSNVGRVILMAKQAENYYDLKARIGSIKKEDVKETVNGILDTIEKYILEKEKIEAANYRNWRELVLKVFTLAKYEKRGGI